MWRYSFNLVMRELELATKKKQALEELFASGKISQSTREYLETELKEAIADLETHLQSLKNKMNARAGELEKQIGILEIFLANLEIHHAAGEITDEIYEKENKAISLGLETTKQEVNEIKSALSATAAKPAETPETTPAPETTQPAQSEVATAETPSGQPTA